MLPVFWTKTDKPEVAGFERNIQNMQELKQNDE
jgi:hypothetical protein